MKVLVFAHTPPPFHGQSYMVAQLLENVGGTNASDPENMVFYHVDARVSRGIEDVGSWRFAKLLLLAGYIVQGWLIWLRHRPDAFYYVPAPAKGSAICRDWLVLTLLAPLFRHRVFHWHGAGLGGWVSRGLQKKSLAARLTRRLLLGHELSIVMDDYSRGEVAVFAPRRTEIVANGIADPCPAFETTVLPERRQRLAQRTTESTATPPPPPFRLLFLGHATASKGLFDLLEAVARANARLERDGSAQRLRLTVAGAFLDPAEEKQFRQRIAEKDLLVPVSGKPEQAVVYAGYVDANFKTQLLRESDALCFASFFPNEVQPVAIVEALAFGLPVLVSQWHGLPSMLPEHLLHLTAPQDPASLAEALPRLFGEARFGEYRQCYFDRYTMTRHCQRMREVLLSLAQEA